MAEQAPRKRSLFSFSRFAFPKNYAAKPVDEPLPLLQKAISISRPQRDQARDGYGLRYETQPGFSSKSWTHSILLGGLNTDDANAFANYLHEFFKAPPLQSKTPHQAVDFTLSRLALNFLPDRSFHSPYEGLHELRMEAYEKDTAGLKKAVKHAKETGLALEFAYRSLRKDERGAPREEVHIRRVNVSSVDGLGFTGVHSRGVRRFNFANMESAAYDGYSKKVSTETLVRLTFTGGVDHNELETLVGRVEDNGVLGLGIDTAFEERQLALEEYKRNTKLLFSSLKENTHG